jgi:ribonuclease HI
VDLIKVTLVYTPGHREIPENEEADQFAKEGTNVVPSLAKMLASVLLWFKKSSGVI